MKFKKDYEIIEILNINDLLENEIKFNYETFINILLNSLSNKDLLTLLIIFENDKILFENDYYTINYNEMFFKIKNYLLKNNIDLLEILNNECIKKDLINLIIEND